MKKQTEIDLMWLLAFAPFICMALLAAAMYIQLQFFGGFDQMRKYREAEAKWNQQCHRLHGKIISIGKSEVSRVCVSPDGRWLMYY